MEDFESFENNGKRQKILEDINARIGQTYIRYLLGQEGTDKEEEINPFIYSFILISIDYYG